MPGGLEEGSYDTQGLYVYYLLNDFGSFIGWLGVVVAAGAVAWMGLRERTVSRWVGVVSVIPVLQTTLMLVGLGVPGVQGLLAADLAGGRRTRPHLREAHDHPLKPDSSARSPSGIALNCRVPGLTGCAGGQMVGTDPSTREAPP